MLSADLDLARKLLEKQALIGQTLTYREFASALGITDPPVINKCTTILEALMREDAEQHRPLLSSMVVQQGALAIPRLGFYQVLDSLKLYQGEELGAEAKHWHLTEMRKIKEYYTLRHNEK